MNWIHLAIDARAFEALSEIAHLAGNNERELELRKKAINIASVVAHETATLPSLFENCQLLRDTWAESRERFTMQAEQAQRDVAAEATKHQRHAEILEQIRVGGWASLSLPTPKAALAMLLDGKRLTVNCHTALYDANDGITWLTNAYGVDGILCNEPDMLTVTWFLADMAMGKDYGPVPY